MLSLCICFTILCSCDAESLSDSETTSALEKTTVQIEEEVRETNKENETTSALEKTTVQIEEEISETNKENETTYAIIIESPPEHYFYSYNSYYEVEQALMCKDSIAYSLLRKEQNNCGKIYINTLAGFSSGDFKIAVPKINNEPISLWDEKGYSSVTLFTCELYNLPWLWYNCEVDEQSVDIKVSYLAAVENLNIEPTATYSEILQIIAPKAPSPENFGNYESYKNVYEKKIVLYDGVEVVAMIMELKSHSDIYVMFQYDGLLISLYGDSSLFTDGFFRAFSVCTQ